MPGKYITTALVQYNYMCSYIILCYIHRKNSIVQKRLYHNMDDLLQLDVAIPDMAEVLTEVREFINT